MHNGIKILVVDDSKIIAKNNVERINAYCKGMANITEIHIATSFSSAYKKAKEVKPDIIYSDLHLSPTEIGITLIEKLRKDQIIDYRTQCCYYTANSDSANLLPYIERGKDFILNKGATSDQFILVFKAMLHRHTNCNLRYLMNLPVDIFIHEVFSIEGKTGGCLIKYISKKTTGLQQTFAQMKFSSLKNSITAFDFMLQIMDFTIINTTYYHSHRTAIVGQNNTTYSMTLMYEDFRGEFKVSKSFVGDFKRKYSL